MTGRVIVVGSVNEDLVLAADHLPTPGETVLASSATRLPGGKGANQAVAAARFGAAVALVGAVGTDKEGDRAVAALEVEGIDLRGLSRQPSLATGLAVVVTAGGENQIVVAAGANGALDAGLVDAGLAAVDLVADDVVLVSFEVPDRAVEAAASSAAACGARVVVNPAPARPLGPALTAAAPVVVPNEGEAMALGTPAGLARTTGAAVVVTRGPAGAFIIEPSGAETVVAAPQVGAVDSTGAGDTLTGVLAAGLAAGASLVEAVTDAVMAASLSVTFVGARAGMPDAQAVAEFRLRSDGPAGPAPGPPG